MKAFPNKTGYENEGRGMDLRDYFAAKAMATLLATDPKKWHEMYQDQYGNMLEGVAKLAYMQADEMMKVRAK